MDHDFSAVKKVKSVQYRKQNSCSKYINTLHLCSIPLLIKVPDKSKCDVDCQYYDLISVSRHLQLICNHDIFTLLAPIH